MAIPSSGPISGTNPDESPEAGAKGTTSASAGGTVGTHPPVEQLELLVGPSTTDQLNTVRLRLIPLACWRVDDLRFKFDSSFVRPSIEAEMTRLKELIRTERLRDCPLSIFGHADPVGNDDYNKVLSGRRAAAIYGMLVRDADLWERLFSNHFGGDVWGDDALATMLARVAEDGSSADSGIVFGREKITDGAGGPSKTSPPQPPKSPPPPSQVRALAANAGPRRQLYLAYMDKLCGDLKLDKKKDFLGHGADANGKGDFQGCSEFNPVLIFSEAKQARFTRAAREKDAAVTAERDRDNADNRRVMILIFRRGSKVEPSRWPCPRWNEGVAGCRKRFFSDGETRRTRRLPDADRKFDDARDTLACRFYQRVSDSTPCDQIAGVDFRYALERIEDLPWSDAARLTIESTDGVQRRVFRMAEGEVIDDMLVFTFRHCRPGILYRGRIQDGSIVVPLFPPTELFRIVDPNDPQNVIPLNPPNEFAGDPPSGGGGVRPDPNDQTILGGGLE